MARARSTVRPHDIKISIPMDLSARVDQNLWDPLLKKPRYGARSELITNLLRIWCDLQEGHNEHVEPELRSAIKGTPL